MLLSTMHRTAEITDSKKRKPTVIQFYNQNKCGVDVVDNMLRMYSCRIASRRWTAAVWANLLDIAALNAWVCYKQVTGDNISRKCFIVQLIEQLCGSNCHNIEQEIPFGFPMVTQKSSTCSTVGCKNKVSIICRCCQTNICGTCCHPSAPKVRISECRKCYCI
jgi:hypothetical protein